MSFLERCSKSMFSHLCDEWEGCQLRSTALGCLILLAEKHNKNDCKSKLSGQNQAKLVEDDKAQTQEGNCRRRSGEDGQNEDGGGQTGGRKEGSEGGPDV